jgi:hypothetical protein
MQVAMEIYLGQDGSFYKIKRFLENPVFLTYEEISQKEIDGLVCLLRDNNSIKQNGAGFFNKPAADFGARTGTSDSESQERYLSNDY